MKKNAKLIGSVALALLSVTAQNAQSVNIVEAKTVSSNPNPIYIPKRHDKKTWAQQGRDAKNRKRKIGR